jgi:uncharacterized protein YjdB
MPRLDRSIGVRRLLARALAAGALLALPACSGGGGGGGTGPDPVTEVSVAAPADSVGEGYTLALSATARASGTVVTGRAVAWSSSSPDVAAVAPDGTVTGVAAGSATITAKSEGVSGTFALRVVKLPVASASFGRDTAVVPAGESRTFAVQLKDANGRTLSGRTVSWATTNGGVALVNGSGAVTGVAPGSADVTATSEGRTATLHVSVVKQVAAVVAVTPPFAAVGVDAPVQLHATAATASGAPVYVPEIAWAAVDAGVAVTSTGLVSASQPGAYRVRAGQDAAADTATIAALGPSSLLLTAFPSGQAVAAAGAGGSFDVPVVIDMSRASATGDLGSLQLEVAYDPAVLAYDSYAAAAHGSLGVASPAAGTVRVAFAETSAQGSGAFTVVTLRFHVIAGTPSGSRAALRVRTTAVPTSTGFVAYSTPIAAGGTVRVR